MAASSGKSKSDGAGSGSDAAALIARAREQIGKNDSAAAVKTIQQALASPGCTPEQRLEAAAEYAAAGAKPEAVECYVEAGTNFLYDAGDMQKARSAFAQAHQIDPTNLDVIFQMGQADVVEGRTQDALAKFIDVLRKSNLKHVPALFEAGCIYQANGQYDQAILAFKKVLDRDKNHVQAIVHMGQLHQTKGMVPEALGYYMQAAEIAREGNQVGTAQQLLNMVLALDGSNQKARIMLDDIADRNRENDEEAIAMAKAIKSAPTIISAPAGEETTAGPTAAAPPSATGPPAGEIAQPTGEAKRALAEIGAQRDALARELEELTSSRLEVEAALAQAKDETEAATAARDAAVGGRADAERQTGELVAVLERHKKQLSDAMRRKTELDGEVAAANAALQSAKKGESEIAASAEKRRAQLESELADLADKCAQAETAVAAVETRRLELQSGLADLADKRAQAETAAASAEKKRAQLERQLAELAEKHAQADAAVKSGKEAAAAVEGESAKIVAQVDALREQIAILSKAKTHDAAAAAKATAEAAKAAAEAATAAADLKALRSELEAAEARRVQAASDAESAADTRDKIRAEAAAAQANLDSLRDRVKAAAGSAADAEKLKKVAGQTKEMEASAASAAAALAQTKSALEALEARKREIDDAYAKSKSMAAAAEAKAAEAVRAAEQAEALRSKRESDAEALAVRIASLESGLKDADARAKLVQGEHAALQEATAKVTAARKAVLDLEERKNTLEAQGNAAEEQLSRVRTETAAAQAALEEARAAGEGVRISGELRRRAGDESYAESVAASVPPETCANALRTIESMAAEGSIPFEIAAELAGLIHEGRAVEALRVARARANLEAAPAPYLLAAGDLARDLGDAAGARESYRTLAAADPSKDGVVHQRMLELFLTFADQGTAAALQRDDAHYAAAQEPVKALEAYADLVARFPDDPTFRQELGEVHQRLGNTGAAGLAYTQAMSQYLGSDDAAKAVELVPKLLGVRPDSGDALELAARAYERAGRPHDALLKLDDALNAYRRGKAASDVERICRRLADIAEDPVPYRRELAALLQEVGDTSGACEQLVEGAERLVKWSNAADALSLLKEAGVLAADDEALRDRVAGVKEKAVEAQRSIEHAARAAMFLSKKQYDKAAEAYRAAVDKNPYNADACYQLACLLSDHFPDLPTAEQLLDNAAELRPGHTATRYRLALVKAARGDVEQAVELLVALARFDENNADFIDQFVERLEKDAASGAVAAKYRLGIAYRELGRVEEALVILQSIQREAEYIVLCLNAIGLCLRRQGLDTAAAKRFQKAIETSGYPEVQYNEALYNLGDLYEAKHDPESLALSLSSFEELYARDCTYRDVADRIKSVKAKLGAAEGPKVKRLPNRSEAANDR